MWYDPAELDRSEWIIMLMNKLSSSEQYFASSPIEQLGSFHGIFRKRTLNFGSRIMVLVFEKFFSI